MRHANNFDLIRLVAAFLVLESHAYALRGLAYEPLQTLTGLGGGGWGVFTFFSISGYLTARSWDADPNPARYALRRALRIYPALIAVTVLTVFALGPAMTTLPLSDYLSHKGAWSYLTTATGFKIGHVLPGVFDSNWYPSRVNGSLWTIPRELKLYIVVPFAWIAARRLGAWSLLAAWAALFCADLAAWPEYRPLLEFSTYFVFGMFIAALPDEAMTYVLWTGAAALALGAMFRPSGVDMRCFSAVFIPCLAVGLGASREIAPALRRVGDLSYGTYIFAFPAQQIAMAFWPDAPVWASVAAPVPPILFLAWLSWTFVERPALALKPARPGSRPAAAGGKDAGKRGAAKKGAGERGSGKKEPAPAPS